jgi:hypothetical protein
MNFKDYVHEASKKHPEIGGLSGCANLDRAFRHLASVGFILAEMEIVAQDEFTLDVLLPFTGQDKFLILGVT